MKQFITTLAMALLLTTNANSQCAQTTGNYEFSITNDAKSITIKARNTTSTIRSSYVDPAIDGNFVGLVFGIKWSVKSDIILSSISPVAPFDMVASGTIIEKNNFRFQSYGDEAKELPLLSKEWMAGNWNTIATIPYTGSLAYGDHFELAECGFDETTNPYFAQMDTKGNYGQYAPNLVRNVSEVGGIQTANAVIVYPNPTQGILNVDVSSSGATRATFHVMDMTGKSIKVIQSNLIEGLNKITVNVNDLAIGIYMIKVSDGKALNFSQQFAKQ